MHIALRLARAGYWGGDPDKVLAAPARAVLAALNYEQFLGDYERTWRKKNEGNKEI